MPLIRALAEATQMGSQRARGVMLARIGYAKKKLNN